MEQLYKIDEEVKVVITGKIKEVYIGYNVELKKDVLRYKIVEGESGTAIGVEENKIEINSHLKLKDFEDFLMEKHSQQYIGTDDAMVDDFSKWLEDLSIDDWIKYGNKYKEEK